MSCRIIGEPGGREKVRNGGVNQIKAEYIHV
jgi:hypothetical protein